MICNICNQPIGEEEREHRTNQGLVYHEFCWLEEHRGPTLEESLDAIDERQLKRRFSHGF